MCSLKAEGCWVAVVFKLNDTTLIITVGLFSLIAYCTQQKRTGHDNRHFVKLWPFNCKCT